MNLYEAISLLRIDAPASSRVVATMHVAHVVNGHPLVVRYVATVEHADGTRDESIQFSLERAVDVTLGKVNFRAAYPDVAQVCDELHLEYIGATERPGRCSTSYFTDMGEGSASRGNTFMLPDDRLTPADLRAALAESQAKFTSRRTAALVA